MDGYYRLAPHCLFSQSSLTIQDTLPGVALSTVGWAFLPQPLIKKTPYRLVYRQSERHSLNWGVFSDNSNFHKVDQKYLIQDMAFRKGFLEVGCSSKRIHLCKGIACQERTWTLSKGTTKTVMLCSSWLPRCCDHTHVEEQCSGRCVYFGSQF